MEGEITPSPIFAAGLVIAVNPSVELLALKPDGAKPAEALARAFDRGVLDRQAALAPLLGELDARGAGRQQQGPVVSRPKRRGQRRAACSSNFA